MPHEKSRGPAFPFDDLSRSWLGAGGIAVAIGIAYFVAARFGLAFRAKPGGVAVFWPAAGIAIGALIALGPNARLPVAIAVAAATIASKLLITGNLWLGITFGLVCAGQTLLTAWLIERWFGRVFNLEDVSQVLGFLVASTAGAAMAAFGTVAAISFVHSTASPLEVWRPWFAACLLGTVTVAPLLIGLGAAARQLPPRRELIEGAIGLVTLAALSVFLISLPQGYWATALPVALVFPVLLWITVRCRPLFAAAAAFIVGLAIVWSTTFNMGHFGDPSVPLAARILAAQTFVLVGALLTFVLAALFAERRRSEAALKDSNNQLQLALDAAELGVWSIDFKSACFQCDARDSRNHKHSRVKPPRTVAEARAFVHPDDLPGLDEAYAVSQRTGENFKTEYRLKPSAEGCRSSEERWVAVEALVVQSPDGGGVRLLGVSRDITARKRTAERLQRSERAFRELLQALPAAIFVTDAAGHVTYCNQGAINLWGVEPRLGKDKWYNLSQCRYADGRPMPLADCPVEIALKQGRIEQDREVIIERRDGTRIPIIPYPTPLRDENGVITGAVNMIVDISLRKKAEVALAERNLQLALAGKAALVGSYAYDPSTDRIHISESYPAIHGLPEGTIESTRSEWERRVHPDDLARIAALRNQAYRERRSECGVEYRIVRGGEVRWIESRSFISYGNDGHPQRVIGVNIDVTQRKQTEAVLKESQARLADALVAGQVMAFEWDAVTGQSQRSDNTDLILGLDQAMTRSSPNDFLRRVHPDDRESFKTHIRKLRPGISSYALSFRFCRSDGREMWLEETAKAEFDATGRLLRVKGLTRDITERKQAEEKLQKSEQALRELLGALPAAIYVTDAAGRITYCNRSAVDLWGTRPKLAEDRWCDLAQFYHTDGTPVAPEDCPMEIALKQGGVVRGQEVILERHDGTRVPIIPYPTPLHDGTGAIVGAVNMTVDISERKKAELALAERNVQLALAGKAGLVGSYAYDANTEWMQVSEGYVAIQGLPEGTTEIARSRWLANVHPEDRIRMEALRHQSFRQRRPEQSLEYRIVRGGEVRWIESRSFISYGIDGRPQRVIGVNIDVTERKRAEEHQRVLVAELDHRVKNVLATVSAVAAHTLDASSSMAHFVAALDGRLRSMASTHELLSDRQWRGMPLAELLQRELAPYARSDNTEICGPDVMLTVEAGQGVAMVLHELVTNAAKHGALSTRKGRVSVRWYQPLNGRVPDQLVIEWQETGGPSVKAPSKSGYGTGVIEDLLPYEFGGTVDLAFASGGVRCRLEIPAAWITSVSRLHTNSNEFYPARTISRH